MYHYYGLIQDLPPPQVVVIGTGGGAGVTTITVPTGGVPAGSLIVVATTTQSTSGCTVSDSAGNSYSVAQSLSGGISQLFICPNCLALAAGNTITVHGSGGSFGASASSAVYITGRATSSPTDQTASGSGTSTAPSAGPITPSKANCVVIGWAAFSSTSTVALTEGTGFFVPPMTAAHQTPGQVGGGNQVQSTATAATFNATIGASVAWVAGIVSFLPASGITVTVDGKVGLEFLATLQADGETPSEFTRAFSADAEIPTEFRSGVMLDGSVPSEALGTMQRDGNVPMEWTGGLIVTADGLVSLEWLAGTLTDSKLPTEARGGVTRDAMVPTEFASTLRADNNVPLEARASVLSDSFLPAEFLRGIVTDALLPTEAQAGMQADGSVPTEFRGTVQVSFDSLVPLEFGGFPLIYCYREGAPLIEGFYYWAKLVRARAPRDAFHATFPAKHINGLWYDYPAGNPIKLDPGDAINPIPAAPLPPN